MDNSSKPCGKAICGSLVLLAIGILIGVLVTKYVWPGSSTARARNASSTGESAALPAPASVTASASSQIQAWNPLGQMRQMQAEIDQVFQRSFDDLRLNPKLQVFQEEPGYSLSMDVRDLKDRYQVRAFLA